MRELIATVGPDLARYRPAQRYHVVDERHLAEDGLPSDNLMTSVVALEQSSSANDLARIVEALQAKLSDSHDPELRRVFVDWVHQTAERVAPPGGWVPPVRTLEELKMTLVERAADWTVIRLRGRDQQRRNDMAGRTRFGLMLALVLVAAGAWMVGQGSTITAAQSNFVGGDPSRPDASDIRALRLRFEAGARSNWHSHGGFQVIMAEEGRGRTQVQGEPLQEMEPGVPYYAGPGVVHWHGAAPDSYMVQLTVVGGEGPTDWLGPVSDEDYLGQ